MRLRPVPAAPVLVCALLAGCSSGSDDTTARSASPTASTSATPAAAPSPSASGSPGVSAVPTESVAAGSSATPGASSRATATRAGSSVVGTAPGDYTYDVSGTYSLGGAPQQAQGTTTLTVSPLQGNRQRSTLRSEQGGDTVQDVVHQSNGVHLARLALGTPVNKEFRADPPVLLFPSPAEPGARWSWRATSTDRSSTVAATNRVLRTETVTIGGERVPTVVLQTRLVISGDVSYTADVTTWVATGYRLPVKDHTRGSGKWGTLAFSTDVTSVMRSTRPA